MAKDNGKVIPPIPGETGAATMKLWRGATLKRICPCGFWDIKPSHCAHFVSHVIGARFGYTCSAHLGGKSLSKTMGVSIRVDDLYNNADSAARGLFDATKERPPGLIYVVQKANYVAATNTLRSGKAVLPKRHVGIYLDGSTVYHYSNTKDLVVVQSVAAFRKHYSVPTYLLYSPFPPAHGSPTPPPEGLTTGTEAPA